MPAAPPASRQWEIDALRGLMLALMTVTHLPTRLTEPIGQPLGFVSAAEGFVLLSAYMAGLVYGRRAWRDGVVAMRQAFWRRALVVYACHAATLLFLFTAIAWIGIKVDQPAVKDLMAYYLEHPWSALGSGLLLVYEPPLLDILPMYVLFMLASPWVLALSMRWGWTPLILASVALWALAQFGLGQWLYGHLALLLSLRVPYSETGSFETLAWQFLWMLGLWMGASRNDPVAPRFVFPAPVVLIAVAIAFAGFAWRHAVGQTPFGAQHHLNVLFDKWHLAPLRLLNLFALMVVTIRFGPALAQRLPRLRALETLGQASLPVFCAHLVVVLLTLSLLGAHYDRAWWKDALLLGACFLSLYAVARLSLWFDKPDDEAAAQARSVKAAPRASG
ncbi:MAG TPA: OpgC domain-containing protein [Ramlibacter sp.]|nr:OpgC domain-containing protein [Ramlibacter sp.]